MISHTLGIYQKESSALVRYRTERFLKQDLACDY